uniref:hypothetical protein n=1 Tax=Salinibacterium sp. TaxID=1915057 RepID=UPI00286C9AD5
QAMFVRRDLFLRLGGFANQALMEDIELSRRLLAVGRPACLRQPGCGSRACPRAALEGLPRCVFA